MLRCWFSPPQAYLIAITQGLYQGNFLQYYPSFFDNVRLSLNPQWIGAYGFHLWFLAFLYGLHSNRAALEARLLDLSAELARQGFAILAFDMRGQGKSSRTPIPMGYFEQFDVLARSPIQNWGVHAQLVVGAFQWEDQPCYWRQHANLLYEELSVSMNG